MEDNTNTGIITDRNFAHSVEDLTPSFKEVRHLLGDSRTLFPCKSAQRATKARIADILAALEDDIEWKLEFPLLRSSRPLDPS